MAKILIVDDSAMSRRILRRILETADHSVIEADDGMVAIEKYFLEKPDLVMLDLLMKGISGMEVLQKIRQERITATIVTPHWPSAVWYPTIKMMSVAPPTPIPRHHVLPAPGNAPDILAKNPHRSLTAWRISGAVSRIKDGIRPPHH